MPTRSASPEARPLTALSIMGLCVSVLLIGCAAEKQPASRYSQSQDTAPARIIDPATLKDAVPRVEPKSRWGNAESYVVLGRRYQTLASNENYVERGVASWYGTKFHGHRTSSGDTYDMYGMSAAHKSLPLPTYAQVTNLRNGKSVIVKINDRGPFHDNRLIDLSYAAAAKLDILSAGTGLVEVRAINPQRHLADQQKPKITASKPKFAAAHQPVAKTAPDPVMYLQLGAFSDRDNAERLRSRLDGLELPGALHISEGVAGEQRVYRVRVGPMPTVDSADQASRILATHGIDSPRIVID
ncbi:MAG: septal ring lytic transglycosylase RlpA family protein [Thiogranum sp.]|nr:septal ring lytic transglycosylase RlpA family protein [Thiogranum sp.]